MIQAFADMIYLFSCGSLGISPKLNHVIDIDEICQQAVTQGVWHTVFLAINNLYEDGSLNIEHEVFNDLKHQTMAAVAINIKRLFMIHKLIQKLEYSGIKCCVLKGEVLSYLYNNPNCRISGDTDILIEIDKKDKAIKILTQFGFNVKPLNATSHHIVATHPVAGMVELHLHLHDELFEDVWFDNKMLNQEEYRIIKCDGEGIPTLGITDGLIFVALHYIKHFLSCGVGIRQLMDILLYMKNYYTEIDWKRFNDLMEHLKYQKFIDNSVGIGVKYLNFNTEYLPKVTCDDSIMAKILYDIENGGVFGKNEDDRVGFYMQYTKARFNRFKNEDYHAYIKRWWRPNLIRVIFPHIKNLTIKFPYVKKTPLLYPVAWLHRIINLFIGFVKKEKSMNRYINTGEGFMENDVVKKRMDLIRELDMI